MAFLELIIHNPFFWAFAGMFGMVVGMALVSGRLGHSSLLGILIIMLCDLSRMVLVLPFIGQPRLEPGIINWLGGGFFMLAAALVAVPALGINWRQAPDCKMQLKTDGIYRLVRNPIYLADLLFTLGFSLFFGSLIGLALLPAWWVAYLCLVLIEEQSLEQALGQVYLDYKKKVKGRLLPGLPF